MTMPRYENAVPDTFDFLGGRSVFGRRVVGPLEQIREVRGGFPFRALNEVVDRLAAASIPRRPIYAVVGSVRTLYRKRRDHSRLSWGESDRLTRVAPLAVRAGRVLGSQEAGVRWLGRQNEALNGCRLL